MSETPSEELSNSVSKLVELNKQITEAKEDIKILVQAEKSLKLQVKKLMTDNGLDVINSIKARQFKWAIREDPNATYPVSSNNGKVELGFVAQELNTALGDKNDIIRVVDNTNPDQLDASYARLIPVMVKAIHELSTKNTALETRVAALEAA